MSLINRCCPSGVCLTVSPYGRLSGVQPWWQVLGSQRKKADTGLNGFAWMPHRLFSVEEMQNQGAERRREAQGDRDRERQRGSQSSGTRWPWVTTKLLNKSHPCQTLELQPRSTMAPCQLKLRDQSGITQRQIKKWPSGFWRLEFQIIHSAFTAFIRNHTSCIRATLARL